jgi:hypothetical protein
MKFLYEADKLLCLFHQFVGLAAACVDKIDTAKSQNCRAQEGVGGVGEKLPENLARIKKLPLWSSLICQLLHSIDFWVNKMWSYSAD